MTPDQDKQAREMLADYWNGKETNDGLAYALAAALARAERAEAERDVAWDAALVERLHEFANGCRGSMWQSRDETISLMDEAADALTAAQDRIDALEADIKGMRDSVAELEGFGRDWPSHGNVPLAIVAGYAIYKQRESQAWNAALEQAIERIDGSWSWDDPDFMADVYDDLRRNLKKGDTP